MNTPACRLKANWMQMGTMVYKLPKFAYRVPITPTTKMVEHLGIIKERSDGRWNWWRRKSAAHRTWLGPAQGVAVSQGAAEMRVLEGWETEDELQATRDFQEEKQMTPEQAQSLEQAICDLPGMSTEQGCSLSQILSGGGPWPTYILKWGEDMPKHIHKALKEDGEAALILDANGEVFSMIVYNELVGMREMSVATMRELNQRSRYV
jgi:hypothetical protein